MPLTLRIRPQVLLRSWPTNHPNPRFTPKPKIPKNPKRPAQSNCFANMISVIIRLITKNIWLLICWRTLLKEIICAQIVDKLSSGVIVWRDIKELIHRPVISDIPVTFASKLLVVKITCLSMKVYILQVDPRFLVQNVVSLNFAICSYFKLCYAILSYIKLF